jgi:hypothetical protein
VANVLGILQSLSKGWSPVKKLFALLFVGGLLSLAVGCPPATTGTTSHGTTPPKGFNVPTMPGGMGPGGMTGMHPGGEKATEKTGPGGTEKTTEKTGPAGTEKSTEKAGKDTKK